MATAVEESSVKVSEVKEEIKTGLTLSLTGFGGYEKFKVLTVGCPQAEALPNANVVVHMKANGINFFELMSLQGLYDKLPKPPFTPGYEGSGDIIMVGKDVENFKVGDRVICFSKTGIWSEYVSIPEAHCFKMPEAMTYEEGAAIPVNYITAYHMLFNLANLRSGQSVLIHMAAGGVGTAATQLCKSVPNVTVFGTTSASKHDAVRKLGVDYPIDYRTQDYVAEIRKVQPQGVDIVLDPLNGADAVKGFELLKPFGKIIHFGAANAVSGPRRSYWSMLKTYLGIKSYTPLSLLTQNRAVCGYHIGYVEDVELIAEAVNGVLSLYEQGRVKPQIDSVWAYADIDKAMNRMHERLNVGKVIITPHKSPEVEGDK